ncbi:hypothetical protein ABZ920_16275 [Streptomyces sp. NPDC046831]|uniref:hypothetical protein n=1 Tax=Streptomyces sp. NPDC046831 TaxID=3154805 RepID=UPI0033FD4283
MSVLVFDGMKMLDLSGPAEVLSEANHFEANYQLSTVPGRPRHGLRPRGRSRSHAEAAAQPCGRSAPTARRAYGR